MISPTKFLLRSLGMILVALVFGYGVGTNAATVNGFTYVHDLQSITITGYIGAGGAVVIPDTIGAWQSRQTKYFQLVGDPFIKRYYP